jgi:hypothetical protein
MCGAFMGLQCCEWIDCKFEEEYYLEQTSMLNFVKLVDKYINKYKELFFFACITHFFFLLNIAKWFKARKFTLHIVNSVFLVNESIIRHS